MLGTWRIRNLIAASEERYRLRAAQHAVAAFPTVVERRPHPLAAPLIVTLTSYPPRFGTLAATLRSLLDQTMQADRTILWIAPTDLDRLPGEVSALERHGLEIRACADTRSYKKLIPALAMFPGSYFVTADDDVYYPPGWLAGLVAAIPPGERAAVAGRAHLAHFDEHGLARPYAGWELATSSPRAIDPHTRLFPTGVGGVLYPPDAFAPEVLDEAAFLSLCPHGDDIWFFWMARRAGTGQVGAAGAFRHVAWPASQRVALYNENLLGDRNDAQIRAMEARYGPVP